MCALPDVSRYNEPETIGNSRSRSDSSPLPPKAASPNEAQVNKVVKLQSIKYDAPALSTARVPAIVGIAQREGTKCFDYQEFKGLCGAKDAVDRFKPAWR